MIEQIHPTYCCWTSACRYGWLCGHAKIRESRLATMARSGRYRIRNAGRQEKIMKSGFNGYLSKADRRTFAC